MGKSNDWREGGGKVAPSIKKGRDYVNAGQEDQMEIVGYYPDRVRNILTWVFIVLTVGFLRLVFYWKPEWMLMMTHVKCSLRRARKILLKDQYLQWFVEEVKEMTLDCISKAGVDNTGTEPITPASRVADDSDSDDLPLVSNSGVVRYFVSKKVKYMWDPAVELFDKLKGLDSDHACSFFHEARPPSDIARKQQRLLYGENVIDVRVDSILILLVTQALNPFYIFQVFSCILWYLDEYAAYATVIVLMSVVSLSVEIYQTRTMQRALKSTISSNSIVSVCRGEEEYEDVPSDMLVAGDIIEVPRHGCIMQCDAVLLTGNCIVNESMLTGESVPVTKTPLPNPHLHPSQPAVMYNMKEHGRHTLFCGTHVIQTRYYGKQKVKAVVLRTGFSTLKGELVRSIMFPKPVDFKFARDTYKFIGVLAGISSAGMVYTIVVMTRDGFGVGKIILRMFDLVTIVIPPALPAAMTIGIVFAQRRLKKQGIFCISPKSITLCGAINTFCFDKTGTLTEDGLDMWGVVPARDKCFHDEVKNVPDLGREPMMVAMATCHSLTIIEGELSGDPLDIRMFQSTHWDLEEPGEDTSKFDVFMPTLVRPKTPDIVRTSENFDSSESIPFEVGILRQFTFSSKLQRMSVIARTLSKTHFDLYTKGAPEMIASLSRPSTVPPDFHDVLLKYTQHGYRVLALAWKPLKKLNYVKVQRAQREQMERDLIFLGLLVMENRLKPSTTSIIQQLKEANIRTIMVTGDNMLTALSVARDCQMLESCDKAILVQVVPPSDSQEAYVQWNYAEDESGSVKEIMTKKLKDIVTVPMDVTPQTHFAITGKSWLHMRRYFPELVYKLVIRGTVFARFSPEQKQQLVETLQELGYYVGMCGDGANDCGALKTAHTGISLSEAEASVASPFTSKTPDVSCVPTAIREGRAALVTSFGVFKYMAGYSLTQFVSVCMLYWIGANLTDFTFLYIDLFIITSLAATFGYTGAYPALARQPPPISLISFTPILSIILHMIIITAFQVITWFLVMKQPWFEAFVINEEDDYYCYEMTALFAISSFQYVTLAISFAKGSPYRKSLFSNVYFLVNIILLTALNVWVVVYPTDGLAKFLELKLFPSLPFRGIIVALAIANFFLCFLMETYVLDSSFVQRRCQQALELRSERKNMKYLNIERELCESPDWPPVSQTSQSLAQLMSLESTPHHAPTDAYVNHYMDDDDGEDDVISDTSRLNTPLKGSIASRRSKKRTRTKSTTSTGSKFSLSAMDILNDVNISSDKLGLSGYAEDMDRSRLSDDIVAIVPDSPRSPSVPLLGVQFVVHNTGVPHAGPSPADIIDTAITAPQFPEETQL